MLTCRPPSYRSHLATPLHAIALSNFPGIFPHLFFAWRDTTISPYVDSFSVTTPAPYPYCSRATVNTTTVLAGILSNGPAGGLDGLFVQGRRARVRVCKVGRVFDGLLWLVVLPLLLSYSASALHVLFSLFFSSCSAWCASVTFLSFTVPSRYSVACLSTTFTLGGDVIRTS